MNFELRERLRRGFCRAASDFSVSVCKIDHLPHTVALADSVVSGAALIGRSESHVWLTVAVTRLAAQKPSVVGGLALARTPPAAGTQTADSRVPRPPVV